MIGENTYILNNDEIEMAVQCYLEKHSFRSRFRVLSVRQRGKKGNLFTVKLVGMDENPNRFLKKQGPSEPANLSGIKPTGGSSPAETGRGIAPGQ